MAPAGRGQATERRARGASPRAVGVPPWRPGPQEPSCTSPAICRPLFCKAKWRLKRGHALEIFPPVRLEIWVQKLTLRSMWSAKAQLLRSAGGAGAITGGHGAAVAAGKSCAFALHIRISKRTGRIFPTWALNNAPSSPPFPVRAGALPPGDRCGLIRVRGSRCPGSDIWKGFDD